MALFYTMKETGNHSTWREGCTPWYSTSTMLSLTILAWSDGCVRCQLSMTRNLGLMGSSGKELLLLNNLAPTWFGDRIKMINRRAHEAVTWPVLRWLESGPWYNLLENALSLPENDPRPTFEEEFFIIQQIKTMLPALKSFHLMESPAPLASVPDSTTSRSLCPNSQCRKNSTKY